MSCRLHQLSVSLFAPNSKNDLFANINNHTTYAKTCRSKLACARLLPSLLQPAVKCNT